MDSDTAHTATEPKRLSWSLKATLAATLALAGVLLLTAGAGCHRGTAPPGPLEGGVTGRVVSDGDGEIRLDDATAASASAAPVSGALVELVGADRAVNADAQGRFDFTEVTAGFYMLRIEAPGKSVLETPVTVFAGVTVQLGDYPVDRDTAIASVLDFLGLDAEEEFRPWMVQAPHHPLPPSVQVAPGLEDSQAVGPQVLEVMEPQWFVYVDRFTILRWLHPVSFCFVDPFDGAVECHDRTSWPVLNGVDYYSDEDRVLTIADTAYLPVEPPVPDDKQAAPHPKLPTLLPEGLVAVAPKGADCAPGEGTVYALVVRGYRHSSATADKAAIEALLQKGLFPGNLVLSAYDSSGTTPREDFVREFDRLCALTEPCDTLFVYFAAHGGRQGVKLDHNAFPSPPKFLGALFADPPSDVVGSGHMRWENCEACHLVLMVDACHAGHYTRSSERDRFEAMTGKHVAVMTATSHSREAGSFGRLHLLRETGGVYTRRVNDAAAALGVGSSAWDPWGDVGGAPGIQRLHESTRAGLAAMFDPWDQFIGQDPQLYLRIPGEDESCFDDSGLPGEGEGSVLPGEGEGEEEGSVLPGEGEGEGEGSVLPGEGEGEGSVLPGEGEGEGSVLPGEGEGEGSVLPGEGEGEPTLSLPEAIINSLFIDVVRVVTRFDEETVEAVVDLLELRHRPLGSLSVSTFVELAAKVPTLDVRLLASTLRIDLDEQALGWLFNADAFKDDEAPVGFGNGCLNPPFIARSDLGELVCPAAAWRLPVEAGEWIFLAVRSVEGSFFGGGEWEYRFGFVFDADGDPTNNFVPEPEMANDYFRDTDRWYEMVRDPSIIALGPRWDLHVFEARDGTVSRVPSAARMIVRDGVLMLMVPASEFEISRPPFRVTSFKHKGDFGAMPPHDWFGDYYPDLSEPLAEIPEGAFLDLDAL